jgi:hypothetical protein
VDLGLGGLSASHFGWCCGVCSSEGKLGYRGGVIAKCPCQDFRNLVVGKERG